MLADLPNVTVICYAGLTVDLAREQGCGIVIRGLRAVSDFEFEFQLANMSRHLAPDVDYVFLTPKEQFTFISSERWCGRSRCSAGTCRASCTRSWLRRWNSAVPFPGRAERRS